MACLPKAPAYQEYPGDILNNEIFVRMTYDERGLYWTLRMYSWQNETLPSDLLELSEICRLDHDHFKRLWEPRISRFFAPCQVSLRELWNRRSRHTERSFKLKSKVGRRQASAGPRYVGLNQTLK